MRITTTLYCVQYIQYIVQCIVYDVQHTHTRNRHIVIMKATFHLTHTQTMHGTKSYVTNYATPHCLEVTDPLI